MFVSTLTEEGIIKESLGYGRVPSPPVLGPMLIEDGRAVLGAPVSFL